MTEPATIPLNKLTAWAGNVRKTDSAKGIDELAASITAHGLLQSLVVLKSKRGKFAVVAGGRRLRALQALAAAGTLPADHAVRCLVLTGDVDGGEISLAENTVREPMHPADEFEAFLALLEGGMPATDIAARFGITETVVQRRLKLARVSPAIIAAFRQGGLNLEEVMAFAVVDDHSVQEQVFGNLRDGWSGDADDIRDALTEHDVPATDRRVQFVTLAAYEAAGGAVRRDLFTDGDRGIAILDVPLLDRLALDKLQDAAADVRAEGWKWVELRSEFDWSEWSQCKHCRPEAAPLLDGEAAELQRLLEEQDDLLSDEDAGDDDARLQAIEERIGELEDREEFYSAQSLGNAGALVTIGHEGGLEIRRGLVLPEDAREAFRRETSEDKQPSQAPDVPALSTNLIADLTTERSAALSAVLSGNPRVALAAVVHALVLDVFHVHGDTCLWISTTPKTFPGLEESKAVTALEAERTRWGDTLPGNPDQLWTWCLEQHADTLVGLLAFCAASSVNVALTKADHPDSGRMAHGEALAAALSFEMRDWFTPTAANYLGRVSKVLILDALQEALKVPPAPAWVKLKKSELALLAERQLAGTGWLPPLLRPATSGDDAQQAA